MLRATLGAGARAAERGEFTLRAFLNGKLDLVQAESVMELITARTDDAARVARDHRDGRLSSIIDDLRSGLLSLAAELEAAIDFSEEGIAELDRTRWASRTEAMSARIAELRETHRLGRRFREGARVAIVGKPNVGKSTLLNALLGEERVIVSEIPGTTRDVIEESVDVGGVPVVLVDTAGLRSADEPIERLGIERTRREIAKADLSLVVLDGSRPFDEADAAVLDATHNKARIVLINKSDQVSETPGDYDAPIISALHGFGLGEVRARLSTALAGSTATDQVLVTSERHVALLEQAERALSRALLAVRSDNPPEVVAVDLAAAMDHLGEIIGVATPDDILDRVFAEFCIGK